LSLTDLVLFFRRKEEAEREKEKERGMEGRKKISI
jgi:hypothetical protein